MCVCVCAFEAYRTNPAQTLLYSPTLFSSRAAHEDPSLFGSQPNIAQILTNKVTTKLAKAQSFKHHKSPNLFKKFSFNRKQQQDIRKQQQVQEQQQQSSSSSSVYMKTNERDVTSAVVDARGARLVNEYWGVSLEIPEGALPVGVRQEVYFVISDPRLCENAPPLDLENGAFDASVHTGVS